MFDLEIESRKVNCSKLEGFDGIGVGSGSYVEK